MHLLVGPQKSTDSTFRNRSPITASEAACCKAMKHLRHRGAAVLWLTPWLGNHRALWFYAKHEYEDYGLVFFHMGKKKVENRVYAKRLSRIAA